MAAQMKVEPCPYLNVGTAVRITRGALINREGILLENRSGCYVVLSVSTIERSVRVHVRREDVTPLEKQPVFIASRLNYQAS